MGRSANAMAALALNRFGMGPRRGSIEAIKSDPRGALLAEIARPRAALLLDVTLPTSAQAFRTVADSNAERRARQIVAAKAKRAAEAVADGTDPAGNQPEAAMAADPVPDAGRRIYLAEAQARINAALNADIGLAERLVWFWSNHFCISANKIQSMSGAYEREAIRPHVLGRFGDMLQAVVRHPAMLFYLDNTASLGPNSVAGINRSRGLNENLAREILELHTLGVRGGYTQEDVIAFAKVLTGWTMIPAGDNPEHGGEFTFNRRLHEPGPQRILGKTYEDRGADQGQAVLDDLAAHPATAVHVAIKMVQHFVADEPPMALVETLARAFRDTGGDLKAVTEALLTAPDAWDAPATKLRRPSEWVIAMVRAAGVPADAARFTSGQATMGEPLWRPPSPRGYTDDEGTWIDGMGRRLDIANFFAERIAGRIDPRQVMEAVLGSTLSAETVQAVNRAESRQQALALLFMSPELQRR